MSYECIGHSTGEKFTFFYGGIPSQWYPAKFVLDKEEYNCCEQYMMAMKAMLFLDMDAFKIIMETDDPKVQKAAGRTVRNFDPVKWDLNRKLIVYRGNWARYTQNKDQLDWLVSTAGTTLVEASPWDTIWGIGLKADDPLAQFRSTWKGTNDLGEIETQVREDWLAMCAHGIKP